MPIELSLTKPPGYTRQKTLRTGAARYYWSIPTWAKKQGCPLLPVAIGADRIQAIIEAEAQNRAFDLWRMCRKPAKPLAIPAGPKKAAKAQLRCFSDLASDCLAIKPALAS